MQLKSHYLLMRTSSYEMINIACMKLKLRNPDTEVLVIWYDMWRLDPTVSSAICQAREIEELTPSLVLLVTRNGEAGFQNDREKRMNFGHSFL